MEPALETGAIIRNIAAARLIATSRLRIVMAGLRAELLRPTGRPVPANSLANKVEVWPAVAQAMDLPAGLRAQALAQAAAAILEAAVAVEAVVPSEEGAAADTVDRALGLPAVVALPVSEEAAVAVAAAVAGGADKQDPIM